MSVYRSQSVRNDGYTYIEEQAPLPYNHIVVTGVMRHACFYRQNVNDIPSLLPLFPGRTRGCKYLLHGRSGGRYSTVRASHQQEAPPAAAERAPPGEPPRLLPALRFAVKDGITPSLQVVGTPKGYKGYIQS